LKLPPADAYYKLKHTIEEVNKVMYEAAGAYVCVWGGWGGGASEWVCGWVGVGCGGVGTVHCLVQLRGGS